MEGRPYRLGHLPSRNLYIYAFESPGSSGNLSQIPLLVFIPWDSRVKIPLMKITPACRINGRIRVPGDKSISHRAAILASLATGTSRISNFSPSEDCAATLSCLERLGVSIVRSNQYVQVSCETGLIAPQQELDCGNSGSSIRMLAGVLAGHDFTATLTGDTSLSTRPMNRIIEPLEKMGATVKSRAGKPPLTVIGAKPLKPICYELPIASAQVKSCVLLAGLQAEGQTEVVEKLGATRDHTERMLEWFGLPLSSSVDESGSVVISVNGGRSFDARDISVPGDISSAAFLIAAAALLPGSSLEIDDVGVNPTRTFFLSVLNSLGFSLEIISKPEVCNEPIADISVKGNLGHASPSENSNLISGSAIPRLIDELPLLAVVGTQLQRGIEIRGAGELRYKESDRISTTVKNLRAMGAEVEEFEDGLAVAGSASLHGARLDSYGDHRIAMAFTVAALLAQGESEIVNSDCVGVSFPEFFGVLESIVER